ALPATAYLAACVWRGRGAGRGRRLPALPLGPVGFASLFLSPFYRPAPTPRYILPRRGICFIACASPPDPAHGPCPLARRARARRGCVRVGLVDRGGRLRGIAMPDYHPAGRGGGSTVLASADGAALPPGRLPELPGPRGRVVCSRRDDRARRGARPLPGDGLA